MSTRDRGFVRNSRFGDGPVIPGTNRANTKKWYALGRGAEGPRVLAVPGTCEACGSARCACIWCTKLMGGKCPGCAGISGVKTA